jgi:hypothetical protein
MTVYSSDGHRGVGRNNSSLPSYPSREGFVGGQRSYHYPHCESTHGDTPNLYDPVERQREEQMRINAMLRDGHHL